ncbi:hypothetical protein HNY73_015402 [Argiope bruennichi]|uniref:Uncharacterized protein n=1 Tax=Argiope bruennichi TaxID=94029 RepID=A0A8T0EWN8_ARGBR|nr:hypothetical protein HNY73_015402 [Argiope bruennichi]
MPSGNGGSSNQINQTMSASNSSTIAQPPDVACIPHVRQLPRKTPPPPYEIQMSKMSPMLLPGTSQTTESSTRELEIAAEARKLIKKMYEEIMRTDQQMPQSHSEEQSEQQVRQLLKSPMRQQDPLLQHASSLNLVVQRQQADARIIPACGKTLVDSSTNQIIQQKTLLYSPPPQLDLERVTIGREGRIVDPPQNSPQNEDLLKNSRKKKLWNPSKVMQTRSNIKGSTTPVVGDGSDSENRTYEEIEDVKSSQSINSCQAAYDSIEYYCLEREFENPSGQASSVSSAVSEPGPAGLKRKFRNPRVKIRRQLSAPSTRKFRHLGQSPETVLEAIATCYDLTPDEWMVAWKLGQKGVAPRERAKLLGVRLHKD